MVRNALDRGSRPGPGRPPFAGCTWRIVLPKVVGICVPPYDSRFVFCATFGLCRNLLPVVKAMSMGTRLTNHWSEPLVAVLSRRDFMRELSVFRLLASASGRSAYLC